MKTSAVSRRELLAAPKARPLFPSLGKLLTLALAAGSAAVAAPEKDAPTSPKKDAEETELTTLSPLVDELKWLKAEKVYVTTVSRHAEDAFRAAAAVTVISNEDIRRSGARSLPEALRLAPGISVGKIMGTRTSVAIRGLGEVYSPFLLVMIDGRSIYQINNSGVHWPLEDTLLEDIDRIEVVRGPGGTLWGANAVNGVINIVTKSATKTAGGYVSGGGGTEQRGFAYGRFGAPIGDWWLRGWVKHQDREEHLGGVDYQRLTQGGFRLDREADTYSFTFSGDYLESNWGDAGQLPVTTLPLATTPFLPVDYSSERGNLRGQFTRTWGETVLQTQVYFDHHRDDSTGLVNNIVQVQDVVDVDAQVRFPIADSWMGMVGTGYRYLPSHLNNHSYFGWNPNNRRQQLFSAFHQSEFTLIEDELNLFLGTKVEHNDFTQWEFSPNARLAWTPNERHTLWGAVSRAVQVPGRSNNDIQGAILPVDVGSPFAFLRFSGNKAVEAQELISYEIGYRTRLAEQATLDLTTFYNTYHNMRFGSIGTPIIGAPVIIPVTSINGETGETYGFELAADYRPVEDVRVRASYSLLSGDFREPNNAPSSALSKDPKHQVRLWTQFDLPKDLSLDLVGRWVSGIDGTFQSVTGYYGLDARIAWEPNDQWEISIVGQNLLKPHQFEFVEDTGVRAQATPVPRAGYVQVTYRF